MSKAREDPAVHGIAGQYTHSVSDLRLEIPCWILDIEHSHDENTFSDAL
jgi:hypothetical protein